VDDQQKKQEEAQKWLLIERNIQLPIERLGGTLSLERRTGLTTMTLPELNQLAIELQACHSPNDAINAVVLGISESHRVQREQEAKGFDELAGPAEISMEP
jgi:hypothetical protein